MWFTTYNIIYFSSLCTLYNSGLEIPNWSHSDFLIFFLRKGESFVVIVLPDDLIKSFFYTVMFTKKKNNNLGEGGCLLDRWFNIGDLLFIKKNIGDLLYVV